MEVRECVSLQGIFLCVGREVVLSAREQASLISTQLGVISWGVIETVWWWGTLVHVEVHVRGIYVAVQWQTSLDRVFARTARLWSVHSQLVRSWNITCWKWTTLKKWTTILINSLWGNKNCTTYQSHKLLTGFN